MKIIGLQKLTMLDFPGRAAATVYLAGCNFHCPVCQNTEYVDRALVDQKEIIDEDAFFAFLATQKGTLDGVCVSGGEGTLYSDLPEFVGKIKKMGFQVKLDTNGSNPRMLAELLKEGLLDYVEMDIMNEEPRYAKTAGLPPMLVHNILSRVCESIDILRSADIEYEYRTTVVRNFHTEESFQGIARLIKGAKKYVIQNFITSDHAKDPSLEGFSREELEQFADIVRGSVDEVVIR